MIAVARLRSFELRRGNRGKSRHSSITTFINKSGDGKGSGRKLVNSNIEVRTVMGRCENRGQTQSQARWANPVIEIKRPE